MTPMKVQQFHDGAFEPQDLVRLQTALDVAWHEVKASIADRDAAREKLSMIILNLDRARLGLDAAQLKATAVRTFHATKDL